MNIASAISLIAFSISGILFLSSVITELLIAQTLKRTADRSAPKIIFQHLGAFLLCAIVFYYDAVVDLDAGVLPISTPLFITGCHSAFCFFSIFNTLSPYKTTQQHAS